MGLDQPPPVEQQLRQPGQIAADVLIDVREARHHVAEQEQHHQPTDADQQRRVDRRAYELVTQGVDLLLVGDVALERTLEVAGALGGADHGDVEVGKGLRRALERARQGLPLAQRGDDIGQHAAHGRTRLLLGQRGHRLGERNAGPQQGEQFLVEQQQRKARSPTAAPRTREREHDQPPPGGEHARLGFGGGVEFGFDDPRVGGDRLYPVAHR